MAGEGRPVAVGDAAVLVEVADARSARTLATAARARAGPDVVDVVPGLASVLVVFDPHRTTSARVADWLARVVPDRAAADEPATVVIPAVFDGPDLVDVARACDLDPAGVVAGLTGARLEVAVLGFSPGFAYLEGLPAPLASVGRRDRPRPSVPAGSVAVAGGFAAVYPQATPGGWQLVGRTGRRAVRPGPSPLRPAPTRRRGAVHHGAGSGVRPALARRPDARPPPRPAGRQRGAHGLHGGGPGPARPGPGPRTATAWPTSGCPGPGRPTRWPTGWPTSWSGTGRRRPRSR